MAEREGFEPSVPLLVAHAISSRAPSASSDISPLQKNLLTGLQDKGDLMSRTSFQKLQLI
jgi:hypothetical protein